MRKTAAAVLAGTVIVGLAAGGCRDSRTAASADGTVKIMVGGIDKVIYLPAKLTEQLGYFKQQGLKVQLLTEPAGAQAENVLLSGDVQGVVGFYDHTVDLQTKNKCVESVVQMAEVPGEVELVSTAKAGQIRGPADFAGKRLGVTSPGSSTDFLTQYLASKAGVSPTKITRVKAGAGQTFIKSLENGGIDAGMTTDPTVAQLLSTKKAKPLLDMRTEAGTKKALGGLYPSTSLYMDCAYVKRNGPTVQKLANALVKTLRWMHGKSGAEIAAKMPDGFKGGDTSLYEKAVGDSVGMFNTDGRMDPEAAKNVLNVLGEFSPNVKGKQDQIDLTKTYTTQFADKASK